MSADNWAICPKCKVANDKANADRIIEAEKQYGKIDSTEYRALIKKAERKIGLEETMREDFSMAIDCNGLFYVNYKGRCDTCGFKHEFHHDKQLT